MAAVLFLVGSGQEDPSVCITWVKWSERYWQRQNPNVSISILPLRSFKIVDKLLNVPDLVGRPDYAMASELPLVFWEASYDNIEWTYDPGNVHKHHCLFKHINWVSLLESLEHIQRVLYERWAKLAIQTTVVNSVLSFLQEWYHFTFL